jgi:hypothetical protein
MAAAVTRKVLVPAPQSAVAPAAEPPTLSVIIAAYNGADVIGGAIESVLAQTRPADEIVVCDDGSRDDLDAALAPYLDRIVLVRKQNGGASTALNEAARTAGSEWVVQLDQDDAFAPERLAAIAELAQARPDLDVIATDAAMVMEGRGEVARYNALHRFETGDQRAEIIRSCFFGWPAMRREKLLAIDGFDPALRVTWDWDCWVRLILSGCPAGLVDEPLYRWHLGPGTLSSDLGRNARENLVVLQKVIDDPSVSERERDVAREMSAIHEQRALLLEAKQSLQEGRPDARRRALAVVTGRGFPPQARAKALLSAVAPGISRRRLQAQAAQPPSDADLAHR